MKEKLFRFGVRVSALLATLGVFSMLAPRVFAGDGIDPLNDPAIGLNVMWMLIAGFLVFFMQAGFALVETGFTRAKNVAHTMMMNMMVFCIGALGYWLTGFALQFGAVNFTYPAVGAAAAWAHSPPPWATWRGCWARRCCASARWACWAAAVSCSWASAPTWPCSPSSSSRWSSWTPRPPSPPARWPSA
ncbi:hypothetical protein [Candidatus Amarobacter glycogenicus]|uniref:hypothetical protein n=1 Tax=Candidatus Amarobacter glycogenicus TaxID=3140699 RepID=UPI0031350497|nr:ammonium transporter [Dehalococcoidia bacterium]